MMQRAFIIGNPRSGTSLLRVMLNSHSCIAAAPECGFMQWWYSKYKDWKETDVDSLKVEKFISDVRTSKKIEGWNLDFSKLNNQIIALRPKDYGKLCEAVFLSYAIHQDKDPGVIVDKNNYYIQHLQEIHSIWPDAKYIFIIRDGRDVACSYINLNSVRTESPYKPILPKDISSIASDWTSNNHRALDFMHDLPQEKGIIIRYEDLILNTSHTLNSICKLFDLKFEESMLTYYESSNFKNDEPQITIDWKRKTLEKPDEKNIGKYKFQLTESEIRTFNKIAEDVLKQFNYEL